VAVAAVVPREVMEWAELRVYMNHAQLSSDQIRSDQLSSDQIRSDQIRSAHLSSAQLSSARLASDQISTSQLRTAQLGSARLMDTMDTKAHMVYNGALACGSKHAQHARVAEDESVTLAHWTWRQSVAFALKTVKNTLRRAYVSGNYEWS